MRQVPAATPYRPGKNGFSKQHNTKGSGPADNIYIFYQRLWPGQIANTITSLTLALGLMYFILFHLSDNDNDGENINDKSEKICTCLMFDTSELRENSSSRSYSTSPTLHGATLRVRLTFFFQLQSLGQIFEISTSFITPV